MARPVLSGTCPVKPLYGLGHRAAAQFQGLGNLFIAYASGSQLVWPWDPHLPMVIKPRPTYAYTHTHTHTYIYTGAKS